MDRAILAPTLGTNDFIADGAMDPDKVLARIEESADLEMDKAVFSNDCLGSKPTSDKISADNEEDGYKNNWLILKDHISSAFGGSTTPGDVDVRKVCSQTPAQFAQGVTHVFSDAGGKFWESTSHPNEKEQPRWSCFTLHLHRSATGAHLNSRA